MSTIKEMMLPFGNEMKGISISHATMRTQDLVLSFMNFLQENNDSAFNYMCTVLQTQIFDEELNITWGGIKERLEDSSYEDITSDTVRELLTEFLHERLFMCLNQLAPEGCYFGSHVGDGSDYGFWEIDIE